MLLNFNDLYEEPRRYCQPPTCEKCQEIKSKVSAVVRRSAHVDGRNRTRINANRTAEALATGAKVIATACPFCMTMMKDGVEGEKKGDQVRVQDVAEVVAEAL